MGSILVGYSRVIFLPKYTAYTIPQSYSWVVNSSWYALHMLYYPGPLWPFEFGGYFPIYIYIYINPRSIHAYIRACTARSLTFLGYGVLAPGPQHHSWWPRQRWWWLPGRFIERPWSVPLAQTLRPHGTAKGRWQKLWHTCMCDHSILSLGTLWKTKELIWD